FLRTFVNPALYREASSSHLSAHTSILLLITLRCSCSKTVCKQEMGNCVSSSSALASLEIAATSTVIRVVQATQGRVVDVELVQSGNSSMKVGELMLEFPPGHFVAQIHPADFHTTGSKRATPLSADADADPDSMYVLFPMPRLHTRLTPHELLSFAKLLDSHHHQFPKKVSPSSTKTVCFMFPKVHHVCRLFTSATRVAPVTGEEGNGSGDSEEHACQPALQQILNEQAQAIISFGEPSPAYMRASCHGQQTQVVKPKPWAPKLQTIQER
ncbi:hypothetical protein GOP47_0002248, partial [Adiantum capillus-veneris]